MVVWALVVIVVLLIPILAIVLDSQIGKALADRLSVGSTPSEVDKRLEALESEVHYLTASVDELREESRFLRSLAEGEPAPGESRSLQPPRSEDPGTPRGD